SHALLLDVRAAADEDGEVVPQHLLDLLVEAREDEHLARALEVLEEERGPGLVLLVPALAQERDETSEGNVRAALDLAQPAGRVQGEVGQDVLEVVERMPRQIEAQRLLLEGEQVALRPR